LSRYVVDHGAPKPLGDRRCRQLEAAGLRRDGAYRTATRGGEVWVDADGRTMFAVEPLAFGMTASAQTVLEDGTHVTTEERPPLWLRLLLGPGVTLPAERKSRHRGHVTEGADSRRGRGARSGGGRRADRRPQCTTCARPP
jgi:hypothetical protein